MMGISQSIVLIGICLVVFGTGARPISENSQASEGFLGSLVAVLIKNSKKDVDRVDLAGLHSTHR